MPLYPQLKNPKFYFMILSDAFIFTAALWLAYLFRFEFSLARINIYPPWYLLPWVVPLKMAVFLALGAYRGMWRFTSIRDFWLLGRACVLATLLILGILLYGVGFEGYSRSVLIIDGLLTFLLAGSVRLAIRSYYAATGQRAVLDAGHPGRRPKKTLIVGAGAAGEKILREIMENNELTFDVVGLIDDDTKKHGRAIHGVRVLGTVEDLPDILERKDIEEILIAIPSARGGQIKRIIDTCQHCSISYKILPGFGELIDGRVSVKVLRDIRYEDLLGREPARLNTEGIRHYLEGKTVLITGCGGSIGSELCRQVILFGPARLILVDSHEANLFAIQMELQNERHFENVATVLAHVQNEKLMMDVFGKYRPHVVFHAAAYKHVPMLENNPWEAVYNNIIGSRTVMDISAGYGVERFVLVSTDKAVRPTNVMGASKRVAELLLQMRQGGETRFMAVRFGNVVGSSGSVIPLFRRQIEQGGPVTVTHPEVNRFFMTIPEASQLILQAGAMGEGGEVFILRMGTPVKIADMARDLIRLSGKEPDVDVKIVFTGLRPGEKLHEELITEGEDILPTSHEQLMVLGSTVFAGDGLCQTNSRKWHSDMDSLIVSARCHDAKSIKIILQKMVPEYMPQENESVL
ncbi:MAG: nucleoside-diphosphate sugar epimerase/dehydratase [Smithellaceae bacterium]